MGNQLNSGESQENLENSESLPSASTDVKIEGGSLKSNFTVSNDTIEIIDSDVEDETSTTPQDNNAAESNIKSPDDTKGLDINIEQIDSKEHLTLPKIVENVSESIVEKTETSVAEKSEKNLIEIIDLDEDDTAPLNIEGSTETDEGIGTDSATKSKISNSDEAEPEVNAIEKIIPDSAEDNLSSVNASDILENPNPILNSKPGSPIDSTIVPVGEPEKCTETDGSLKNSDSDAKSDDEIITAVVEIIDLDDDEDDNSAPKPVPQLEAVPESESTSQSTVTKSQGSPVKIISQSTINEISEVLNRLENQIQKLSGSEETAKADEPPTKIPRLSETIIPDIVSKKNDKIDNIIEIIDLDEEDESTVPNKSKSIDQDQTKDVTPKKPGENTTDLIQETENAVQSLITNELMQVDDDDINNLMDLSIKTNEPKECIHFNCKRKTSIYFRAPTFVLSHYRVTKKKNKRQLVCNNCYDEAIYKYEDLCGTLIAHEPLILQNLPSQPDLVEISDSDSDNDDNEKDKFVQEETMNLSRYRDLLTDENINLIICETLAKINLQQQLTWTMQSINSKVTKTAAKSEEMIMEMKELQKLANNMHSSLYHKHQNRVIHELPPVDLNAITENNIENVDPNINVPKMGKLIYPALEVNSRYLAPRIGNGAYILCELNSIYENGHPIFPQRKDGKYCKITFTKRSTTKFISAKHLAYLSPPIVRVPVGVRVIALFQQQLPNIKNAFFPGVIGETLMPSNKFRYLIFFNDGYFQYVKHEQIRLICESSENICDDIDADFNSDKRKFIENYLNQYKSKSLRPMIQARKGQKILTEHNGPWKQLRVTDIDCNLYQVYSEERNSYEWIFRGSSRFAPVFKEVNLNKEAQNQQLFKRKNNEPYVEYIGFEDEQSAASKADHLKHNEMQNQAIVHRAVARKSTVPVPVSPPSAIAATASTSTTTTTTTSTAAPIKYLNNSVIVVEDEGIERGKVIYYTATKHFKPRKYKPHKCGKDCLYDIIDNLAPFNPIARPLLSGWERQICKTKTRKIAIYRAPCGKRLRNMNELHRYLRMSGSPLNVECFDYDTTIHCLAEFVDDAKYIRNTDLSNGIEKMPISCCNYFDSTVPPQCVYSTQRIPTEGVDLNLDPEFLSCCDCDDDCLDKTKCQCWQLTITGAKFGNPNINIDDVGYCYKRLSNPVQTGIYECNSRCKCNSNCLNRVVQHPLSVKLQVFKTTTRGWGLRTLHDIPKGSFICIYAGDLLTEQLSNEFGATEGDEYFAELDYIEVVERIKEGYESDVPEEEPEEADDDFDPKDSEKGSGDSDDEEYTAHFKNNSKKRITTRQSTRKGSTNSQEVSNKSKTISVKPEGNVDSKEKFLMNNIDDGPITISDDEDVRVPINFMPSNYFDGDDEDDIKHKSVRKMFGKDELGFVMDAKRTGNIGRYFNHSCNPNLFVQNVFVDTHDLRFPWVSFFSSVAISASTELTWNYNYDVGCVPGKVLYCQCESTNCRGRLL